MSSMMPTRAAVVGYGPAGRAFSSAIDGIGATVTAVAEVPDSDGWRQARQDGRWVAPLDDIPPEPLLVLSVPDGAIATVAAQLVEAWDRRGVGAYRSAHPVALHLAGSLGTAPLAPLADAGYAPLAFHPLQTFPPGSTAARFAGISVGITGEPVALELARELASRLGVQPLEVPEHARGRYHLAAVMVSNFLPLLLEMGASQLRAALAAGESGDTVSAADAARALRPLMRGMVGSLKDFAPADAMTGPLVRNDRDTVKTHLELLAGDSDADAIYRHLALASLDLAVREGRLGELDARLWQEMLQGED